MKKIQTFIISAIIVFILLLMSVLLFVNNQQETTLGLTGISKTQTTLIGQTVTHYEYNHGWTDITVNNPDIITVRLYDENQNLILTEDINDETLAKEYAFGEYVTIVGNIPSKPLEIIELPSTPTVNDIAVILNKNYGAEGIASFIIYDNYNTSQQTITNKNINIQGTCKVPSVLQSNGNYYYQLTCQFTGRTPICDSQKCKVTIIGSYGSVDTSIQRSEIECLDGQTKCINEESFICQEYEYVSNGFIEGVCGYQYICTTGEELCTDDYHHLTCNQNQYIDNGVTIGQCGVDLGNTVGGSPVPTMCIENSESCANNNYLLCLDGRWLDNGLTQGKCNYNPDPQTKPKPIVVEKYNTALLIIIGILSMILVFLIIIIILIRRKKK